MDDDTVLFCGGGPLDGIRRWSGPVGSQVKVVLHPAQGLVPVITATEVPIENKHRVGWYEIRQSPRTGQRVAVWSGVVN